MRPGKGTEDTRRLATQAEIGEENRGLVVTGGDAAGVETVEVAHEALIQGWGQKPPNAIPLERETTDDALSGFWTIPSGSNRM